jgi:hypothetical protein
MQSPPALRFGGPDLFGLRQRGEQPLRLTDLGHFRGRLKALQRGHEDGVGLVGTPDRLIELSQRKRRTQLEAARALTLSNGDGGLERFLGSRRVGSVTLQQHFPADAMQFGFERAMADPFARRQRFVETRDGALEIACAGFGFGKGNLGESVEEQEVLLAQKFDPATHGLVPTAGCATLSSGQTLEKDPERSPEGQIMLARELGKFDAVHCGTRRIVTHQFEPDCEGSVVGVRADVREARHPRLSVANEGNGAPDVAQRPQGEREIQHRGNPLVVSEAKGQIVVTPGLEERQRVFQGLARFDILTGKPMCDPGYAASDSGLRLVRSRLDVAKESLGVRSHRRQLAAHVACGPPAIVGRQPFRRVLVAKRRLAGSCEGLSRLRRAVAARGNQRVAIGDVQFLPLA